MSLLDTLINVGSANAANKRAFQYSMALQDHQYKLNRNAIREYYTNNRYSLEQAGYNPLLAVPGSTAQGFSASASMSPVMPGSSGAGTDEVNSINSAMSGKAQRALIKEQVKSAKADTKHKQLENEKLQNEILTSPRTVLSGLINNGESKSGNSAIARLTAFKNAYGLQSFQPRSFIKTNISRAKNLVNNVRSIHSATSSVNNGKPFELGIKYFDEPKNNETVGVWNSNRKVNGHILSDDEAKRYLKRKSSRTNSKPPNSFPR